jgi:hypothetical protein
LHWDGQAWSPQKIPGGGNNGTRWRVVSGTSPQDVWLTGTTYFIAYKAGGAYSVTAHYDGSGWSAPAPAQWPADPTFTTGAWPTGTGVLWAVGPGPYLQIPPVTATAIDNRPIMRWDSSDARAGWTRSLTGSRAQLFGISGIADGQMWIVGAGGTILHRGPQSP